MIEFVLGLCLGVALSTAASAIYRLLRLGREIDRRARQEDDLQFTAGE